MEIGDLISVVISSMFDLIRYKVVETKGGEK